MKRFLLSAVLLTTIFALVCSATDTRVLTLGNNNTILKDDANIFLFPQTIVMYRGMVVGEVSAADMYYRLGAHYDMGPGKCVLGVYVDDRNLNVSPFLNTFRPLQNTIGSRLNLFFGRPIGAMDLGVNLFMYHNSDDQSGATPAGPKGSNTNFGLNVGLTPIPNLELAAGFTMDTWKNQDAAGADITKPKGNMEVRVGGRYWWAYSSNVDFVPHVNFGIHNEGYEVPTVTEETNKVMDFTVGWGFNVRPVSQVLLLFDLGVMYEKGTMKSSPVGGTAVEIKHTDMDFPYYKIGLEGHVTNWWDLRLGAVKAWEGHKIEAAGTTKSGTTSTATYLGSGFHFGHLTLDAMIDPAFVLRGPNFISGYNQNVANQVSILYTW
jgi:hypothetical protein